MLGWETSAGVSPEDILSTVLSGFSVGSNTPITSANTILSAFEQLQGQINAFGLTVGTTSIAGGSAGKILFEGAGNVLQESINLFWDQTNNRFGLGTIAPSSQFHQHTLNANTTSVYKITNPIDTLVNVLANGTATIGVGNKIEVGSAFGAKLSTAGGNYLQVLDAYTRVAVDGFYGIGGSGLNFIGDGVGGTTNSPLKISAYGRVAGVLTQRTGLEYDNVPNVANQEPYLLLQKTAGNVGIGTSNPYYQYHQHTLNTDTTIVWGITNPSANLLSVLANGVIKTNSSNSNILVGTGQVLGTGLYNYFFGNDVANSLTTADGNVAMGFQAGKTITSGSNGTYLGYNAGAAITTGRGTFVGGEAGLNTTTGRGTFIGYRAGKLNTTGVGGVLIGENAGQNSIAADNLIAIGDGAAGALNSTSDPYIIAIGKIAGSAMTLASARNVLIGYAAAYQSTSLTDVIGIGFSVLENNSTGNNLIAIGSNAGTSNGAGSGNIFIGNNANAVGLTNVLAIGHSTVVEESNSAVIGSNSLPFSKFIFGNGASKSTPQASVILTTTNGFNTNSTASNMIIAAGRATGNAQPSYFEVQTSNVLASGVTLQSLTGKVRVTGNGELVVLNSANGIVIKDQSDGNYYKIISTAGVLSTVSMGTSIPN